MLRKIIQIDEDKCTGCEMCVSACHEEAIGMVDGKAKLLRDDYCDALGDCLPVCPTGAITFVEREAAPYDEAATLAHLAHEGKSAADIAAAAVAAEVSEDARSFSPSEGGCPGSKPQSFVCPGARARSIERNVAADAEGSETVSASQIASWPIEIKLVPVQAPYFAGADLLVAADCTAFAYGNFHNDCMKGRITIIGCPKLDDVDYAEKLSAILENNDIRSVMVARMEVPCCGGLENAVRRAIEASGKALPLEVVTISCDGRLMD